MAGCESPAAQRMNAEANRIRAEASAYDTRSEANTRAANAAADRREAARQAGHERAMEMMPVTLAVVGLLFLSVPVGFGLVYLVAQRHTQPDHRLLTQVEMMRLEAQRDRQVLAAFIESTLKQDRSPETRRALRHLTSGRG